MSMFSSDEGPMYSEYLNLKELENKIVYCRDCKNFVPNRYYKTEGGRQGYCDVIASIMDGYYKGAEDRNFDDFCSRGERENG